MGLKGQVKREGVIPFWGTPKVLALVAQLQEYPHCWKEIGDFQIICSKVGGFKPFNYLLGVTCYLLSLKCKWLVLNKLCNFTAYKLFVSTNKQLSDPMDSMADPLFSSYSVPLKIWLYSVASNFTWKIFSNFVAFSEYPNFTCKS